jgi:hypothetical protein
MSTQVSLQQLSSEVLTYLQQGERFANIFWDASYIDEGADLGSVEEIEERFNLTARDKLKIQHHNINLETIVAEANKCQPLDLGNGWRELHDFLNYEIEEVPYLISEKYIKRHNLVCVNAVLGANKFKYEGLQRFLTVEEVKQVSISLCKISEQFEERLQLLETDIDEFSDDEMSFEQFFQNFVAYYANASEQGNAMTISIC